MNSSDTVETLKGEYQFRFDDGTEHSFAVELDGTTLQMLRPLPETLPEWTELGYHQCPNCPLNAAEHSHCPVAVSLIDVVTVFQRDISYKEADISVRFNGREYYKRTPLQYGVSSFMGLHMATNGCPIMDRLRPMVFTHLPFASVQETLYRSLSAYLMAQYYVQEEGGTPDWKLEKLAAVYEEIGLVNRSFYQRLANVTGASDAINNALVNLDCFAILTTVPTGREHMAELKATFSAWGQDVEAEKKAGLFQAKDSSSLT